MVQSLPPAFYSEFLSVLAKKRTPSPIRALFPLETRPGLISLLAGRPNPSAFPFLSLTINASNPTDPSKPISAEVTGKTLGEGLQYAPTAGIPDFLGWIAGLQEREHGRKVGEGWRSTVGSGSQDVLHKTILNMVNPGDAVLIERPAYTGVLPTFLQLGVEFVEVPVDAHGPSSQSLRQTLESWPSTKPKPKVLYTVPYGANPSGVTTSIERRREVLQLAREHNFLILEDDPYYFLYFGSAPRPPSYFSLERELPEVGRVVRFDSLSKVLSAGIRLGFASGPEPILAAVDMHTAMSNLQPSSLTQSIAFALLNAWGYDAFKTHTVSVAEFYRGKRDVFESYMKKHLDGLAEWTTPEAGMFFWFKLLVNKDGDEGDSESLIRTKALEKGVLALPGTVFLPNGGKTAYVRASFSLLDEADVEEAIKRLRAVILEARGETE